jgi:hypothetical protein
MTLKRSFLIMFCGFLVLGSLSACTIKDPVKECEVCDECKECDECKVCEKCTHSNDLILPQITYVAKLNYLQTDLDALKINVFDPIIAQLESEGHTVVSIAVDSDNRSGTNKQSFTIEVIFSTNDGTSNGGMLGVLVTKVDGVIPLWEPVTP